MSVAATVLVPPQPVRRWLTVAGPATVLVIAWASSGVRDTMAVANVALLLAIVTVGVAMTTVVGGVATSVVGALALNYFHTEPVHSLRITESADMIAVALLAVLGLMVSAITALRLRQVARERHVEHAANARTRLDEGSGRVQPVTDVWATAIETCSQGLALVDCRIVDVDPVGLPKLSLHRTGIDVGDAVLLLPETGAVVVLADPRLTGHVILTPRAGAGAIELDRRVVAAFIDQLGLAFASTPTSGNRNR